MLQDEFASSLHTVDPGVAVLGKLIQAHMKAPVVVAASDVYSKCLRVFRAYGPVVCSDETALQHIGQLDDPGVQVNMLRIGIWGLQKIVGPFLGVPI